MRRVRVRSGTTACVVPDRTSDDVANAIVRLVPAACRTNGLTTTDGRVAQVGTIARGTLPLDRALGRSRGRRDVDVVAAEHRVVARELGLHGRRRDGVIVAVNAANAVRGLPSTLVRTRVASDRGVELGLEHVGNVHQFPPLAVSCLEPSSELKAGPGGGLTQLCVV